MPPIDTLARQGPLDELDQATLYAHRERRRSFDGVLDLHRTHRIFGGTAMAVADIVVGTFPAAVLSAPLTLKTTVEFAAGASTGLVFEFGSSARGVALWIENDLVGFRAGATGNDAALLEVLSNDLIGEATWPDTFRLEIVASVKPGDGQVAMWLNGNFSRAQAVTGDFGDAPSTWAAASAGAFAAAAQGTVPADVIGSGAPANFSVIEPLSVFTRQHPRQFLAA